ncbi:response regulator [Leeuwenhoekiella sp. A16]|uniref:response regulator n=1 Tax=unclassified Leeuwenhoekiella TaxID=2615029 RepID=UPI003A8006AC|tara:strand:- start:325 stop:708 length:384 start_codon:yes stop_codon:yes gene_type:complete
MHDIKNILVVDDDKIFLVLVSRLLKTFYPKTTITSCLNGREALDYLDKSTPDIILLDINMPIMNGWEFMNRLPLKKQEDLSIFIVSSSIDPRDQRLSKTNVNIEGFIEKPLTPEKLKRVLGVHASNT